MPSGRMASCETGTGRDPREAREPRGGWAQGLALGRCGLLCWVGYPAWEAETPAPPGALPGPELLWAPPGWAWVWGWDGSKDETTGVKLSRSQQSTDGGLFEVWSKWKGVRPCDLPSLHPCAHCLSSLPLTCRQVLRTQSSPVSPHPPFRGPGWGAGGRYTGRPE